MKTLAELRAIREKMKSQIDNRDAADTNDIRVIVGMATCGIAAGARPVMETLLKEVDEKKLSNVVVTQTGCIGLCRFEPIVEVLVPGKEKVTYVHMTAEKAREVVASHLVNGTPVSEYIYNEK